MEVKYQVSRIIRSKRLRGIMMAFAVVVSTLFTYVNAQTPLSAEEKEALVDSITFPWEDWTQVSISGKLKMPGLPVTPSVKIFMERDSSILMSLRAPFFGEVGRAEITDSTILVVNKMKKVYVEESLKSVLSYYPGGLFDIQNILLGRITFPGLGMLSHEIEDMVDIYIDEDGTSSVVVKEEAAFPGVDYGYVVSPDYWPVALLVLPDKFPDISVTLAYDYFEDGYDLSLTYQSEKRNIQATLELDDPDWEGKPIEPIKLNSKLRKVDIYDFMKSF